VVAVVDLAAAAAAAVVVVDVADVIDAQYLQLFTVQAFSF
jgi:peptide subunit release factor RF-3